MRWYSGDPAGGTTMAIPASPAAAVPVSHPAAGGATTIHRPPSGVPTSTIASKSSVSMKNRRLRSWSRTHSVTKFNRRKGCRSAARSAAAWRPSTPPGGDEFSIATDYSIEKSRPGCPIFLWTFTGDYEENGCPTSRRFCEKWKHELRLTGLSFLSSLSLLPRAFGQPLLQDRSRCRPTSGEA